YALHQNYPNPLNSSTRIKYELHRKTKVKIVIYDILGRKIKILVNSTEVAGYKNIVWNGQNDYGFTVASGMYFYRIETENFVKTRKLLVIK
ncbi:MAG: T9SS type A sorting domain-containing protein, partial [Calditrichia bacterium]